MDDRRLRWPSPPTTPGPLRLPCRTLANGLIRAGSPQHRAGSELPSPLLPEHARSIPTALDVSISLGAVPDTPSSAQVSCSRRRRSRPSPDLYGTDDGTNPLQTSTTPTTTPAASRAPGTDSLLLGSLLPESPDSSSRHRWTRLPTPSSTDHLPGFIHASISPPALDSPDSASKSSRLQLPRWPSFASVFFALGSNRLPASELPPQASDFENASWMGPLTPLTSYARIIYEGCTINSSASA